MTTANLKTMTAFTLVAFISVQSGFAFGNNDAVTPVNGAVSNISHELKSLGFKFKVKFSEIEYHGKVKRIEILDNGRIRATIADTSLLIQKTRIKGTRHQAICGPFKLELGTIRDLVFELRVQQKDDGELELVESKFDIAADNWAIGNPEWIKTRGFGMTKSRVISGLRNGLEDNRQLFIQEFASQFASDLFASQIKNQTAIRH